VIQNLYMEYAEHIRLCRHRRHFVDYKQAVDRGGSQSGVVPKVVLYNRFLNEILENLKKTKGRELPRIYNPLIVGDLFFKQAEL